MERCKHDGLGLALGRLREGRLVLARLLFTVHRGLGHHGHAKGAYV